MNEYYSRMWFVACLFAISLIRLSTCVPVVKKQMAANASPHTSTAIIGNKIDENPPLYPSPILDSEGALIGTGVQDTSGRVVGSPATCLVAGIEYTHGQQIYTADQCEFCLCLDGEMYCWWQECPPESDIPCKDRKQFGIPPCNSPYSPYTSSKTTQKPHHGTQSTYQQTTAIPATKTSNASQAPLTSIAQNGTSTTLSTLVTKLSTQKSSTSTETTPTNCVVLGTEYKIGEVLPHDTGNCLECVCGPGARVTCSPHQCAPPEEEDDGVIPLYRPSEQRPDLGVF